MIEICLVVAFLFFNIPMYNIPSLLTAAQDLHMLEINSALNPPTTETGTTHAPAGPVSGHQCLQW